MTAIGLWSAKRPGPSGAAIDSGSTDHRAPSSATILTSDGADILIGGKTVDDRNMAALESVPNT